MRTHALRLAPDHSEALLERGFASLALGERNAGQQRFQQGAELVPPGSDAARRAEAGLRGEQPVSAGGRGAPPPTPEGRRQAVASVPSLM